MTRSQDPRAHDLLADRALHGLDDADARALHALVADDDDSFDLAAAAVDLATLPIEPMPADVAERVAAAAVTAAPASAQPQTLAGWVMPTAPMVQVIEPSPRVQPPLHPQAMRLPPQPPERVAPRPPTTPSPAGTRRRRPALTWFATAASILVIVGASWWLLRGTPAPSTLPPAQARAQLLASASDATRLDWKPTPEAPTATGDVVWSPSAQRGYMRFVGLPANDPAKLQYQLSIFDRLRDQAFPVDGGVFDVTATGEIIIPITAKLHIDDATLFAVTIERPGGVVVSKREHIVVTAART